MGQDWPKRGEKRGIYAIENTRNGKFYVGQAKDIYARWHHHRGRLRAGKHSNPHLQRAWDKDGEAFFTFTLLEEVTTEDLNCKEQAWIDATQAVLSGYNMCPEVASVKGKRHSEAVKAQMSEAARKSWNDPEVRQRRIAISNAGKRAASVLTEAIVAQIRARYKARCPKNGAPALSSEFGVSKTMIHQIVARRVWK